MKNVWQRIKNWLIKKLGGYTEKEFRTVADFKVEPAIIKDSVIMRPHTIRARIHAPMLNPGLSSFRIERELSILLAEELCKNEGEYGIGLEQNGDWDGVLAWAEMPTYAKRKGGDE